MVNIRSCVHEHSMKVNTDLDYNGYTTYSDALTASTCPSGHSNCVFSKYTIYSGGTVTYTVQTFNSSRHRNIRQYAYHEHTIAVTRLNIDVGPYISFGGGRNCPLNMPSCRVDGFYGSTVRYPLSKTQVNEQWTLSRKRTNIRMHESHRHTSPVVIVGLNPSEVQTTLYNLRNCSLGHSSCQVQGYQTVWMARVSYWQYYTNYAEW